MRVELPFVKGHFRGVDSLGDEVVSQNLEQTEVVGHTEETHTNYIVPFDTEKVEQQNLQHNAHRHCHRQHHKHVRRVVENFLKF